MNVFDERFVAHLPFVGQVAALRDGTARALPSRVGAQLGSDENLVHDERYDHACARLVTSGASGKKKQNN